MGSCQIVAIACSACLCIFPPFILQSVGLFTPRWVSNSTCDSIGIIYSCCSGEDNTTCKNTGGGDELDVRVKGLQATSFMIMFFAFVCMCCANCCKGDDDDDLGFCGGIGTLCVMLYPVAGLFSFVGCMLLVPDYSTSQLGYSFVLCLTAGLLVIVFTIVMCGLVCKMVKDDKDSPPSTRPVSPPVPSNAVQPYGGQQLAGNYGRRQQIETNVQVEQMEHTEAAIVHDKETGGVFVLLRKFNITRIIGSVTHSSDDY